MQHFKYKSVLEGKTTQTNTRNSSSFAFTLSTKNLLTERINHPQDIDDAPRLRALPKC